jgi:hypothetical protein
MKKVLILACSSAIFYHCTTVQPVGVKPQEVSTFTSDGIGTYREFPKDVFRSPFPYKDLREEAVRVKSVELVSILDIHALTPGMNFDEVVKKLKKYPFDFVYTQKDGYRIVSYVYKRIFEITNDKKELNIVMDDGSKELGFDYKMAYLMFNKQNKLEMIVSKDEMSTGLGLLKFARDTYRVTKNDGENYIKSDSPDTYFPIELAKSDTLINLKKESKK